jgi:hypothetical protein
MNPGILKPADHRDQASTFMSAADVILYLNPHTTLELNKVMIGRVPCPCVVSGA